MRSFTFLLLMVFSVAAKGQLYSIRYIDTKTNASFRGLSVANRNAVWVSGSKGWVGRTTNGGTDWHFGQVPGYEQCDFRTIYAFDSNNAIIANAGSPAYILRTGDGGNSWQKVYENKDSAAFIDGIDFWNKRKGIVYGDPINGRMLLLHTNSKGKHWKERSKRNRPKMEPGEASFAASGTNIHCMLWGTVVIAAGGKTSKLYISRSNGLRWRTIPTPMLAGKESTGIFSFMTGRGVWNWYIAGGDYKQDTLRTANFFYTRNKGKKWIAPTTTTRGYRECLAAIDTTGLKGGWITSIFALGPTGIDVSTDKGATWQALSDDKDLHVIKVSADHKRLFLAGGKGKLAIMQAAINDEERPYLSIPAP